MIFHVKFQWEMSRVFVMPYKMGSSSATALADYFQTKKIYPNRKFKPIDDDLIINWGNSEEINWRFNNGANVKIFNQPQFIQNASNKILTLQKLHENNIPTLKYATNIDDAKQLFENNLKVYCRTIIQGKGGDGIIIAKTPDELVNCRLYTQEFKNDREYRIHVFNGEIIDIVQKRKMSEEKLNEHGIDPNEVDKSIRNLERGWVFAREDLEVTDEIKIAAINAIRALNLNFGACDILYGRRTKNIAVIEVNSAIGMESGSTTHLRYVAAISKVLNKEFSIDNYNAKYNCNLQYGLYE